MVHPSTPSSLHDQMEEWTLSLTWVPALVPNALLVCPPIYIHKCQFLVAGRVPAFTDPPPVKHWWHGAVVSTGVSTPDMLEPSHASAEWLARGRGCFTRRLLYSRLQHSRPSPGRYELAYDSYTISSRSPQTFCLPFIVCSNSFVHFTGCRVGEFVIWVLGHTGSPPQKTGVKNVPTGAALPTADFYSKKPSGQVQSTLKHHSSDRWGSHGLTGRSSFLPRLSGGGFANLGNTCYINASLQALLALPPFVADMTHPNLYEQTPKDKAELYHALHELALQCTSKDRTRTMDASQIKKHMARMASQYDGHAQQDAHEFLSYLLDMLSAELATRQPPADLEAPGRSQVIPNRLCPTTLNFTSIIQHQRICLTSDCKVCGSSIRVFCLQLRQAFIRCVL